MDFLVKKYTGEKEKGRDRGVDWLQGDFLRWEGRLVVVVVVVFMEVGVVVMVVVPVVVLVVNTSCRDIAAINVTDVTLIEEFVFTAAFSTFDQVRPECHSGSRMVSKFCRWPHS